MTYRTVFVTFLALALLSCSSGEERAGQYLQRGNAFFEQENYEKARLEFQNALQIQPKNIDARFRLAETLEKLGQIRAAASQLLAIVSEDPNHVGARIKLGQIYLLGRAKDKATEMAEEILALSPNNPDALLIQAGVQALEGDKQGAMATAERAIQADPKHANTIAFLAAAYNERGEKVRATELLQQGIQDNPDNNTLRVVLAELANKNGNPAEGARQMGAVIERRPHNLSYRVLRARYQINGGDVDAAEATMREAVAVLPENKDAKVTLIQFLQQQRGFEAAEAELKKYIAAEPENYALQLTLAELYGREKKNDLARKTLLGLIEQDRIGGPEKIKAQNILARMAVAEGDIAKAQEYLSKVLEANPQDVEGLTLKGDLAIQAGDYLGAIADFRAASKTQPNNPELKRLLAKALFENGDKALARDLLQETAAEHPDNFDVRFDYMRLLAEEGQADRVVEELEKLLKDDPRNVRALETLFRAKLAMKDTEGAKQVAIRIQQAYPDKPQGFYLEGLLGQNDKDFEGSIESFERALATDETLIEPLTQMVKSYLALKKPDEALNRLDQTLAKSDKNFVAHNLKGEVLLVKGENDKAIESFAKASELLPRWTTPYKNMARAYAAEKDLNKAEEILIQALEPTGQAPDIALTLSQLYDKQERYEDAIKLYEEVLEAHPDSDAAANNLAMLLANHREDKASLNKAKELTEKLKKIDNPIYQDTLGWVSYKQGNYEEAILYLERATQKLPDNPELRYHLGMSYLGKGDKAEAKHNLEKALVDNASYYGADHAAAALKQL
jgi:tetratricopeptide (TPR) repeat protein